MQRSLHQSTSGTQGMLLSSVSKSYGATVALRRLARIACYFAKFLGNPDPFKEELRRVRSLHQFRDLVREHFR